MKKKIALLSMCIIAAALQAACSSGTQNSSTTSYASSVPDTLYTDTMADGSVAEYSGSSQSSKESDDTISQAESSFVQSEQQSEQWTDENSLPPEEQSVPESSTVNSDTVSSSAESSSEATSTPAESRSAVPTESSINSPESSARVHESSSEQYETIPENHSAPTESSISQEETTHPESSVPESSMIPESIAQNDIFSSIIREESNESSIVNIKRCRIRVDDLVYTGYNLTPTVIVTYNGRTLAKGTDYRIKYSSVPKNIGKNVLTVIMMGNFEGSESYAYMVRPEGTSITDYTAKVSRLVVNWQNKSKAVDRYSIQYSTDKNFSSGNVNTIVTQSTSLLLKDLPQNAEYYFRIRTFVFMGDDRVYSEWSDTVKIALKKVEVIDGVTVIDGMIIANKTYALPSSYGNGLTPEAENAFYKMQSAAAKDGISLYIVSGFRSYSTQDYTYHYFVNDRGRAEADRVSARPGHSEHQTGLAMDINSTSFSFVGTPEAKWLAANCVKYGFIVRYPEGKEQITGYRYEPWHLRYLGIDKAKEIDDSGLTVEEFLGITSQYAD